VRTRDIHVRTRDVKGTVGTSSGIATYGTTLQGASNSSSKGQGTATGAVTDPAVYSGLNPGANVHCAGGDPTGDPNCPQQDIASIAFLVMMQASSGAEEDLKAIMAAVKAINAAKYHERNLINQINQLMAGTNIKCENGDPNCPPGTPSFSFNKIDPAAKASVVFAGPVGGSAGVQSLPLGSLRRQDIKSLALLGETESLAKCGTGGLVPRGAYSGDQVCVEPRILYQAIADNRAAPSRIKPDGLCVQGYVWREAIPSDHVCVTPQTRTQTRADNVRVSSQGQQPPGKRH
jgi:hypothetical protein